MSKINFSLNDFIGAYGVCFDGFLVPTNPAGSPVPMTAVGWMSANGSGTLTVERTVKVPGLAPLEQTATGDYTVKSNGTGTAVLTVSLSNHPTQIERYSFVIDDHNNEVQFIAIGITDANNQPFTPFGPHSAECDLVVRGVGRKQ